MKYIPQIRIFLASPGDVNEERTVALQLFDMLEYDPLFRRDGASGMSICAVAWDKPGGNTPMRDTIPPQTAIKQGLLRPSQCDIVLVLFWRRMGTPLPHPEYQKEDGAPYLSGTEWEFWDAVNAERVTGKPITLLYRRTENPAIDIHNDEQVEQYRLVQRFFKQFRDPVTGTLLGSVNEYATPEDLRLKLLNDLRVIIDGILSSSGMLPSVPTQADVSVQSAPISLTEAQTLRWGTRIYPNSIFGIPVSAPNLRADIFMIMPFAEAFQPIYDDHIRPTAEGLGHTIKRGDDFFGKTSIMTDIWSAINNAKLIIAECTGRNPNVFYELGIAHSLDKAVIMVTQSIDDIPFDIRHLRVIKYDYTPRGMAKFETELKTAIRNLLEE